MPQNKKTINKQHQLKRNERVKKGLCARCSRPQLPGQRHCGYHLGKRKQHSKTRYKTHKEKIIENLKKRYYKMIEEKKCIYCGRKLEEEMDGNYKSCINCRIIRQRRRP